MAEKLTVRPARTQAEFETAMRNAAKAFNAPLVVSIECTKHSPYFKLKNSRLGLLDGEIVGTVDVVKRWMRIGNASVSMGGIADVHVIEDYRGRGYATAIMDDAVGYMESEGYLVSILYNSDKQQLYGGVGYEAIPQRVLALDVATKIPPVKRYRIERVKVEDSADYFFDLCMKGRLAETGLAVRTKRYCAGWPKWYCRRRTTSLLATCDGEPVGVCYVKKLNGNLRLEECRFERSHPNSGLALLRAALGIARQRKLKQLRGTIPEEAPASHLLLDAGARFEIENYVMGRILHPDLLAEKTGIYERGGKPFKSLPKLIGSLLGLNAPLFWEVDEF